MKKILYIAVAVLAVILIQSCNGNSGGNRETVAGDTLTTEASLLTIVDHGGYTVVDVADPWNDSTRLARYVIVPRGSVLPDSLPEGKLIRTPVENAVVYSSVHARVMRELGGINAVKGVADAGYFTMPEIVDGLKNGRVVDVGNSMSPDVERIVALSPDAIMVSPFQNAGHGAIATLGVPVVECADYMEETPLGRAEWVKFIGELTGRRAVADSIYNKVKTDYRALASLVPDDVHRPMVITEKVADGVWYVPGGKSYMARMLADAGAVYPWVDDTSAGSLQLDFPTVFNKAHDADFWLIRNYGQELTLDALRSDYKPNSEFKAFTHGGVYACNTAESTLFEDFPFHPESLLREYINIFHPGLTGDSTLVYYRKAK